MFWLFTGAKCKPKLRLVSLKGRQPNHLREKFMKSKICLMLLALGPATASASWGNQCEFRADRAGGVDAKGVEKVILRAGAGDLKVIGRSDAVRIEARGIACASKQELLDASRLSVRREGNVVTIETSLPQDDPNWLPVVDGQAYIELGIALPATIAVEAIDSSGDASLENLRSLQLQDSSGDLEVQQIAELADISDSSGDLEIDGAGSVRVRDSSGDIEIEDVRGDVEVTSDSSGDMRISEVAGGVRVLQDSSGSIRIEDVKGSVVVEQDSSGDIYAARVGGDFTVNGDSSGSIEHEAVRGAVHVPANKWERNEDVER
jgi:hypothetical protein